MINSNINAIAESETLEQLCDNIATEGDLQYLPKQFSSTLFMQYKFASEYDLSHSHYNENGNFNISLAFCNKCGKILTDKKVCQADDCYKGMDLYWFHDDEYELALQQELYSQDTMVAKPLSRLSSLLDMVKCVVQQLKYGLGFK
jgi:hypothetical protein